MPKYCLQGLKMIGILYIATGKYKVFFESFYKSVFDFFMVDRQKHIYVFTDDTDYFQNFNNVTALKVDFNGFPLDTLLRFRFFNRYKDVLQNTDSLVFMNSNLLIQKTIEYDEFFVGSEQYDFWAVNHPGWFNRGFMDFPYERNPVSAACIPYGQGKNYIQGCLFAGTTNAFLQMCETLDTNIMQDLKNNFIAVWHDESHLNKFFTDKRFCLLDSGFAYPEGWSIPFENKILQIKKEAFFDKMNER